MCLDSVMGVHVRNSNNFPRTSRQEKISKHLNGPLGCKYLQSKIIGFCWVPWVLLLLQTSNSESKPLHGFGSFLIREETVAAAARVRSRKSLRGEVQECLQGGLNWGWFAVVPIGLSTATHESMEDTPLLKCFLFVIFYCRVIMSWHRNIVLVPCRVILYVVFEHDSWGCIII